MPRGARRTVPRRAPPHPSAHAPQGAQRTAGRAAYRRARSVPRRARGGAAAPRPGAPSAPLRRPSPQPGAYLCAAPRGRGARAEHLTVSIAHGSLTRRPFLTDLFAPLSKRVCAPAPPRSTPLPWKGERTRAHTVPIQWSILSVSNVDRTLHHVGLHITCIYTCMGPSSGTRCKHHF